MFTSEQLLRGGQFTRLSGGGSPLNPAKALLSDLAEAAGLPSALHVYRAYLKGSLNLNLSHDTLAGLEDSSLARFYNADDDLAPPRFFQWTETRHWARLEEALEARLVLARPPDSIGQPWTRVHDRRATDLLFPVNRMTPLTLFYAVVREDADWVLYRGNSAADFDRTRFAENFAVDYKLLADKGRVSKSSDCYFKKFHDALGRPWDPSAHPTCDKKCTTLWGATSPEAATAFKETPFTLATHVSSKLILDRKKHLPHHQLYQKICRFGGNGDDDDDDVKDAVLLLRIDGSVVPVRAAFARQVLRPDPRFGCSMHPAVFSHPGLAWKGKTAKAKKRKWRSLGDPAWHCAACEEEEGYRKNLDPRQGQKLFNYQVSTFDLLSMLGMDDAANVAAVRRAADLSCLYYDVEACTILSKSEAGQEELNLDFVPLTKHGQGRKILGRQRPVLVGLVDGVDLEVENDPPSLILSCQPGKCDDMIREGQGRQGVHPRRPGLLHCSLQGSLPGLLQVRGGVAPAGAAAAATAVGGRLLLAVGRGRL